MVWYSHLFKNFSQFVVIYTVKGFNIVNEAELDVTLLKCFLSELCTKQSDEGGFSLMTSYFKLPSLKAIA